jgi:hypothetical protein
MKTIVLAVTMLFSSATQNANEALNKYIPAHFSEPSLHVIGRKKLVCEVTGGTYYVRSDWLCLKRTT